MTMSITALTAPAVYRPSLPEAKREIRRAEKAGRRPAALYLLRVAEEKEVLAAKEVAAKTARLRREKVARARSGGACKRRPTKAWYEVA